MLVRRRELASEVSNRKGESERKGGLSPKRRHAQSQSKAWWFADEGHAKLSLRERS